MRAREIKMLWFIYRLKQFPKFDITVSPVMHLDVVRVLLVLETVKYLGKEVGSVEKNKSYGDVVFVTHTTG